MWANKGPHEHPDFVLSIGTGTKIEEPNAGPQSPAKEKFLTRIFQAFNWNIDAEQAWKDVINFTPPRSRERYHRINLPLDADEPKIDDISSIDHLASLMEINIAVSPDTHAFIGNLLSSMFYFSLDTVNNVGDDRYQCSGQILCRLELPREGRQALYQRMTDAGAHFVVDGRPVPCLKKMPQNAPRYKCNISFTVGDLSDLLVISLNGLTKDSWPISGLPRSLLGLMKAQGLSAAFGRIDHHRSASIIAQSSRKRTIDVV